MTIEYFKKQVATILSSEKDCFFEYSELLKDKCISLENRSYILYYLEEFCLNNFGLSLTIETLEDYEDIECVFIYYSDKLKIRILIDESTSEDYDEFIVELYEVINKAIKLENSIYILK